MKYKFCIVLLLALSPTLRAAQQELDLTRDVDPDGWPKPIPVLIAGFTGEVDGVLKNDLLFMGIQRVTADRSPVYFINGNNAGRVEGRVTDRQKNSLLAKAYTGGSLRSQTHALADDIALAITHKPGIAQTKIAFKG